MSVHAAQQIMGVLAMALIMPSVIAFIVWQLTRKPQQQQEAEQQ